MNPSPQDYHPRNGVKIVHIIMIVLLFQESCIYPSWKGDGVCDDANNFPGCEFDGGDCCGSDVNLYSCSTCVCCGWSSKLA